MKAVGSHGIMRMDKEKGFPENRPLEKELPIANHHFTGLCQFWEVFMCPTSKVKIEISGGPILGPYEPTSITKCQLRVLIIAQISLSTLHPRKQMAGPLKN